MYLLLLNMFPCPEDVFSYDNESATVATEHSPDTNEEEDDCPPYCDCACCGVQLMRTCNCVQIKRPVQFAVYHPVISDLPVLDVFRAIWQPPKLS